MSDFDAWVGRREERDEVISAVPLRLLAATLDIEGGAPEPGDPVPLLWHWLYFLPDVRKSDVGPDGHPRRGPFFPPIPARRRMFAGSSVRVPGTLRVGDHATQIREIASVEQKEGRTGPLLFVRVEASIRTPDGLVLEETETIVYTDAPPARDKGPSATAPEAPWHSEVPTDPALLFRFSALTFNSHRTHYDHAYATGVEGYPAWSFTAPSPPSSSLTWPGGRASWRAGSAFVGLPPSCVARWYDSEVRPRPRGRS